jgi:hypothetical protein
VPVVAAPKATTLYTDQAASSKGVCEFTINITPPTYKKADAKPIKAAVFGRLSFEVSRTIKSTGKKMMIHAAVILSPVSARKINVTSNL